LPELHPSPEPVPTVLIVEDAASVRKALVRILQFEGYRVLTACDGYEALEVLDRAFIHVILIDLMLPDMDWETLTSEVANRWPTGAMVFMTGSTEPDGTSQLPGPLLLKPFDLPEVAKVVRHALRPWLGQPGQ